MISDNEQSEIFDFYFVTSYNSSVHALDYGNSDTTHLEGFLSVIDANLTQTNLGRSNQRLTIGSRGQKTRAAPLFPLKALLLITFWLHKP